MANFIAGREEDYSDFVCSLDIVIPGRATWREPGIHTPGRGYRFSDVQLHIKARRFASPRNDERRVWKPLRPQHVLLHLAAVEMEERDLCIVAQRAGGEAAVEFGEHVLGHGMRVGQRF